MLTLCFGGKKESEAAEAHGPRIKEIIEMA